MSAIMDMLKPCPMCGGFPQVLTVPADAELHRTKDTIKITCSQYGCRMIVANTEPDAVEFWNEPKEPA